MNEKVNPFLVCNHMQVSISISMSGNFDVEYKYINVKIAVVQKKQQGLFLKLPPFRKI